MTKFIYSIRDDVSEIFNDPMIEFKEAFAKRRFQVMMRTLPDGVLPSEYSLWRIGIFDDYKGTVEACEPKMIMRGISDGE